MMLMVKWILKLITTGQGQHQHWMPDMLQLQTSNRQFEKIYLHCICEQQSSMSFHSVTQLGFSQKASVVYDGYFLLNSAESLNLIIILSDRRGQVTFRWLLSHIHSEAHTLAELLRCQDLLSAQANCSGLLLLR